MEDIGKLSVGFINVIFFVHYDCCATFDGCLIIMFLLFCRDLIACFPGLVRLEGPFISSILSLTFSRFSSSFRWSSCNWVLSGDQSDFSTKGLGSVYLEIRKFYSPAKVCD